MAGTSSGPPSFDRDPNAYYRLLFEEARDGVLLWTRDGICVAANRSGHELLGCAPGTLPGRNVRQFVKPEDLDRLEQDMSRIGRGEFQVGEWDILRADGGTIRVEVVGQRLTDGQILGLVRDLSPRLAASQALRDSETRLRATLVNTPGVAVQWFSEEGRVVFWNPASERMFGFTAEEAVGKTLDLLIHTPEETKVFVDTLRRVHEGGGPVGPSEFEFRRRNGERGACLSTVFEIPGEGGRPWFVCMDVDITARLEAERALRDSEARFRSYFELPLVGLAVTSEDMACLEVNARLLEMFGCTREELLGRTWEALTHPDDREAEAGWLERTRGGEIDGFVLDKRFVRRDGSVLDTTLLARCVRKAEGSIHHFIVLVLDVSDRRRIEEQLRQSQKVESIGHLAGGVAHDFNNLLTSILGFAELARASLPADSPARGHLDSVLESGRRGAELTHQLLAFARRKLVSPAPADLGEVLARVRPLLQRLLGEDVELVIDLSEPPGIVRVDIGSFEQVLVNMAVNARDAMKTGGRLSLRTRNLELTAEDLHSQAEAAPGPHVEVTVEDTGQGMSPEVMQRLFEPFFTTKPVGKGTGLGLAMCHGIIRQAGGHIVVTSQPGQGSAFHIRLPRIAEAAMVRTSRDAADTQARGSETVLVVEDDRLVRELARHVLVGRGYRVLLAQDGSSALAQARDLAPIHLLVTDVVMPGMSGRELAQCMTESRPGIKVLYASGYARDVLGARGVLDAGLALIEKPYTPSMLAKRVREVLDAPRPATSPAPR